MNKINNKGISHSDNTSSQQRLWIVVALMLVLIFSALIRLRLVGVPLERDEGEYAYAGQLILQGIPPYQLFYSMKLPGIYAVYACVLAMFGQTHTSIHLGLLVINAITTILVFFLTKRVMNSLSGVVAAACFALLSIGQSVQGVFANSEHFVILPAVGGLLLLLRGLDSDRPWMLFCSGLLLGIGFIIKQHGAAFMALGILYVLADQLRKHPIQLPRLLYRCSSFTLGAVVPYGLTCLILACAGVFDKFWFWTVQYAMAYSSQVPIEYVWTLLMNQAISICGSAPLIWILAGVGLTAIFWDKHVRDHLVFIILFAVFSFLSIFPGLYFRPHYFVLTLPAIAMFAGISVSAAVNKLASTKVSIIQYGLPVLLTILCIALSIYQQRLFLFKLTPAEASRAIYGLNPFPESLEISRFIQAHTKNDDKIAIIGSEPQIYFYSGRHSATGYIYMYALMEDHDFALQMQKEMIREIELNEPKFLVFVQIPTSWLMRSDSHKLIFEWFERYQANNYTLDGLVELHGDTTVYHWSPGVKWPPSSSYWIVVLKRKGIL